MSKIIIMPSNLEQLSLKETDGFLIGIRNWSVNTPFNIDLDTLRRIRHDYPEKELFISLNKNIYSSELEDLKQLLLEIEKICVNGIFFADTCFIEIKQELNLKTPIIWAQEHLTTNYATINFWQRYGTVGTYLSPEITLKEIKEIRDNTSSTLFVPIFGYLPMFTSKRHEIKNYITHFSLKNNSNINYIEKEGNFYPIIDNDEGTVTYTANILNGFEEFLNLNVNYVVLNSFNIEEETFHKVLKIYQERDFSKKEFIDTLFQNVDKGFLYKETIYKVKNYE